MDLFSHFGYLPFTCAQVLDLGITLRQWRRLRPRLIVIRRGVYVAQRGNTDRIRHSQSVAATLLTRTNHFAVSHSAVCVLGLPNPYFGRWDDMPVHLGGRQTRRGRNVRQSSAVPILTSWGPVTDLIDTAVTIAAELPLPQALMVTDDVARKLAGTTDRFELASERCRTEVRRRLTHTCDLPALRLADPAAESPAESFYRGHMLLRGLPEPRCGVPVRGRTGSQYFIDILLQTLAIEVDGRIKYQGPSGVQALIDEKRREDDLRATGLEFHRPFVEELYAEPAHEMDRLLDKCRASGLWTPGPLALPA